MKLGNEVTLSGYRSHLFCGEGLIDSPSSLGFQGGIGEEGRK